MNGDRSKSHLSPQRRQLLSLMQRLNFGRIENLHVRGGEPVFEPPPRRVADIKFGGDNGPRPEISKSDFLLKQQHRELFEQLDRLGNGVVEMLEVKHGLPFRMLVADPIG